MWYHIISLPLFQRLRVPWPSPAKQCKNQKNKLLLLQLIISPFKKQKGFHFIFNEQQQKDSKSIQTSHLIIKLMHFELWHYFTKLKLKETYFRNNFGAKITLMVLCQGFIYCRSQISVITGGSELCSYIQCSYLTNQAKQKIR